MSSGSQQGLSYAAETTAGVLPVPFNRKKLRFTSVSIDGSMTGTQSEEIRDNLISSGEYKTAVEYQGEISGELSYGTYDDLLAAAFHNEWAANVLSIGNVRKTLSILREYKDAGGYHIFKGMQVTAMTLDVPEEGLITVTFTMQGMNREPVTFTLPAGTVAASTTTNPMTNVGVGDIVIDGDVMTDIACVTAVSISIEFTTVAQKCLGKGLSAGKIMATGVNVTGSLTLAWGDESASLNELKYTDTPITFNFPMSDDKGNKYILTVPEATLSGALPSGSRAEILQYQLEYTVRNQSPTLARVPAP